MFKAGPLVQNRDTLKAVSHNKEQGKTQAPKGKSSRDMGLQVMNFLNWKPALK